MNNTVLFNNDLLTVIEQHHKKKVTTFAFDDKAMKKWPAKASHYLPRLVHSKVSAD
ncbi:hypothetical protein [Photobacterium kasasachensis]|uniref:hypothetical protein n=1 Tax=Photobacterium kasasachensis TaxID=2910240 RepID=UPI003D10DABE